MSRLASIKRNFKYQTMIHNMLDGFAYHKMILKRGIPVDYLYLEVNPVFEAMIGLSKEALIGKRATEIIPTIQEDAFDWISVYGRVALTGESIRFESFSEALDKWFLISAYCLQKGYFAVIYQDITVQKKLEKALLFQKEEYETIFNGTQDAMTLYEVDDKGEIRYRRLNRSHELSTGLTTGQVFGKRPREVLGEQMEQLELHSRECVRRRIPLVYEETLHLPVGVRTWSTMLSPVFKGAEIVQIVASRRDITEQQRALKELRESEQRYSSLFENNHSVMLLIDPNDGRIVDANPAACAYYGYPREIIKTLNIGDINIDDDEQIRSEMRKAAAECQQHFYFRHRLAGGEIRNVEVYSGPIHVSGQRFLYSIVHDITARRKAETELYSEKERLNVTLHSIGDGVITTDIQGRVTLLNEVAQTLTGWNADEAIGRPLEEVFDIINEKTLQKCENPVQKVLETGLVVQLANHTALIARDGVERSIADSGAPIKDKNGGVFGVVLVFRDITDKKQQEEEILYLSYHDKLTGLYNRAFFEKEMARLDQEVLLPVSLIIGDVNGLKLANDIFGHEAGDKLLKTMARLLSEACPDHAVIARWGGDEFVIILPLTAPEMAVSICQNIEKKCLLEPEDPIQPSIALGVATKKEAAEDIKLLLKNAEDMMYRRKLLEGKSVRSSLIASLEKTLYERSYETEEHAKRIQSIAIKVGMEMGLSENEQDELSLLAILHDIGKIGIPDYILTKPDKLTPDEWREMQKHPEIGCRIAQSSPELSDIADLILSHHERWDGRGYPLGLKETEIPKLARIISIIDAYDAMTHTRPYKEAVSPSAAITEIIHCAGKQFDPAIVAVFINVLHRRNGGNDWETGVMDEADQHSKIGNF